MPPLPTLYPTPTGTPVFTGLRPDEVAALRGYESTMVGIAIIALLLILVVIAAVVLLAGHH